ncbi:MAG: dicarboxylate transporter/tellurite-resistance protein TehA [Lautropia sp.]|nr:dicarboxylate transporter/tellurite-resistance protein TehA [Lautropia sp.]
MPDSSQKPFPIPISYFSIALGTASLGSAWRYAASANLAPSWPGESLAALASAVWVLLILVYAIKILYYRPAFTADLHDLMQCCYISLIPITTILTGLSILPYTSAIGHILIYLGIIGQLAFSMYRAAGLWRGLHTIKATTPIIYLPTVASSFASTIAMSALHQHELAIMFFGAGMLSWTSLEAAILSRLRTDTPLAPPMRGLIGIQLAPAFVGCNAYFTINGHQLDTIALLLIGYGILQLLFLLRLLPWILEAGFTMGLWGFSFGLATMAGCGMHILVMAPHLALLGYILWIGGSALIGLLWLWTLLTIMRGKFLVKA